MFRRRYADVYHGDERWRAIAVTGSATYSWPADSTYIQNPPYFTGMTMTPAPPQDIVRARALAVFGDSITTDHISPAGAIKPDSPAGRYLLEHQVSRAEFNSYGARRGNHEVMMRGTFANIRIRNRMLDNVEGGFTRYAPTGEVMPIYDAAMALQARRTGRWSSSPARNMAPAARATGPPRARCCSACARSSPRASSASTARTSSAWACCRCNSRDGENAESLGIDRQREILDRRRRRAEPRQDVEVGVTRQDKSEFTITARCRIDTYNELEYFRSGGILHYVLRRLAA